MRKGKYLIKQQIIIEDLLCAWWLSGKEPPANSGAAGESGSITGLGRSTKGSMATYSSILAWEIPWTEGPGGLQLVGWQKSQT